jgi:hypothetical protein
MALTWSIDIQERWRTFFMILRDSVTMYMVLGWHDRVISLHVRKHGRRWVLLLGVEIGYQDGPEEE